MKEYLGARVRPETKQAVAEYAARHKIGVGQAVDTLLERSLTAPVDESTEALILPHFRKVMLDVMTREIQVYIRKVFDELLHQSEMRTAASLRGEIRPQVDRLAALTVLAGKESAAGRAIAADIARTVIQPDIHRIEQAAEDYAGQRVSKWRTKSNGHKEEERNGVTIGG